MLDWPDKMNTFTGAAVATHAETANALKQSLEPTICLLFLNGIVFTLILRAGADTSKLGFQTRDYRSKNVPQRRCGVIYCTRR